MSETTTPTPEDLAAVAAAEQAAANKLAADEAAAEEAKAKKEAAAAKRAEAAAAKKAAEADSEEVTFVCKRYPSLSVVLPDGKHVQFTEQDPEINEITGEPIRSGLFVTSDPDVIEHLESLDAHATAPYGVRRL